LTFATVCVGVSHRSAPLAVRERLAYSPTQAQSFLRRLIEESAPAGAVEEAALLHTCNRTEYYAVGSEADTAASAVWGHVANVHGLAAQERAFIAGYGYRHEGVEAVRHLTEVAAGLDSMILGEDQILGQVKDAARLAAQAGTIGPRLGHIFDVAVRVGRRARRETEIGRGSTSVPSAAVALAQQAAGGLENGVIVVVGAGKMGLLTTRALLSVGVRRVIVSNRSYDRALELAREWDGCAVTFDQLPAALAEADIVITSTAAPHPVVTREMVAAAIAERPHRPLVIVDIAVPRDVEPSVASIPGVRLYDIDSLETVVGERLADRAAAAPDVAAIVADELLAFGDWLASLEVEPTIAALHRWADDVREQEVEKALRRMGPLDDRGRAAVQALAAAVAGKLLHPPSVTLRTHARGAEAASYAAVTRELFGLDEVSSRTNGRVNPKS
jgi:glutamyl-tRNA reductase